MKRISGNKQFVRDFIQSRRQIPNLQAYCRKIMHGSLGARSYLYLHCIASFSFLRKEARLTKVDMGLVNMHCSHNYKDLCTGIIISFIMFIRTEAYRFFQEVWPTFLYGVPQAIFITISVLILIDFVNIRTHIVMRVIWSKWLFRKYVEMLRHSAQAATN